MEKQDKFDPYQMDYFTVILVHFAPYLFLFPILNSFDSIRTRLSP
jgi:hypothetical protein